MSVFYNNDPFWSFFDNINEEVNNFNSLLQRARPASKRLSNSNSKDLTKKDANKGGEIRPWALDPFFANNSLFNFGDDSDFVPPVDIIDKEKNYELHLSVPGASKDGITIDFNKDENQLIIKGDVPSTKPEAKEGENKSGDHYIERSFGNFERSITLPVKVDGDKIKATFENGVLKLEVPKAANGDKDKFKRIEITSSESYSS